VGDLTQLRREAARLRRKAGAPIPMSTLDELEASALNFIITDARMTIRDREAQRADFQALEKSIFED
jgi:hypothetical protein